jgi:hypothetical protein
LACNTRAGARGSFPYSRDHYSIDGLVNLSLSRFKQHWVTLVLFFGGAFGVIYALSIATGVVLPWIAPELFEESTFGFPLHPLVIALQAGQMVVQFALQLTVIGLCLDVLEDQEVSVARAVARLRRLPAALVQMLVIYAVIGVVVAAGAALTWGMVSLGEQALWVILGLGALAAVPLVYYGLGIMFGMVVLVHDPSQGPFEALRTSLAIMDGKRMSGVWVVLVSTVIAMVGFLACCVGAAASLPVSMLVFCSLYLALRNPTTRPPTEASFPV